MSRSLPSRNVRKEHDERIQNQFKHQVHQAQQRQLIDRMNEQVHSAADQVEEVVADESHSESMSISSCNDPNEPGHPVTPNNNYQISPNSSNSEQSQSTSDNITYTQNQPDATAPAPAPTSNDNTAQLSSQSHSNIDIDTSPSAPTPAPSPCNDDNDKKPITDYITSAPHYREPSRRSKGKGKSSSTSEKLPYHGYPVNKGPYSSSS
ncbi:hypothetical protein LTR70_006424 [Exophiala xenobiotica]|uniref:Uncharacterized protein n=1 Tax=Lithohypha guttulata TaxID=1690604 RepID=A0ABR0K2Y5_9EURO|nr:hypothetical protein LTR24_007375 [Lithohypha guttulata]KAK5316256.1 hypothetical protein LTR70_006424 [Exophiala xenobiotica]